MDELKALVETGFTKLKDDLSALWLKVTEMHETTIELYNEVDGVENKLHVDMGRN